MLICYTQHIATTVAWSVSMLVTNVSHAKIAESIKVLFDLWTPVGQGTTYRVWAPEKGHFLGNIYGHTLGKYTQCH